MEQKHFYQKFGTWASLSFLTGATVMVVAFSLFDIQPTPITSSRSQASLLRPGSGQGLQIDIVQPAEGEQVSSQGAVTISALAGAAGGVKNIAVWLDGQLARSCSGASCSITIPSTSLTSQAIHTIEALATGLNGETGSAVRHFSVGSAQ